MKIEDVLYKNFKNDISFEANGQVIVFGEHQSTINPNMPLRFLLYLGRAHDLLKKCDILREYSQFVDTVRKYSHEKNAIKKAIDECIKKGILADYLERKRSEVTNMLIAEYSYEEDIQVKQQEAREDGKKEGKKEGLLLFGKIFRIAKDNPSLMDEQIAEAVGCTTDEVASTRKMFGV